MFVCDGLMGGFLTVREPSLNERGLNETVEFYGKLSSLLERLGVLCTSREKRTVESQRDRHENVSRTDPTLLLLSFKVERLGYPTKDSWGREETGNWRS